MQIRDTQSEEWLDSACVHLIDAALTKSAAYHAFLCDPLIQTRKWRILTVGAAGLPSNRVDHRLRSYARRHWPEDDVLKKLRVNNKRRVLAQCAARSDLAADEPWFGSRLHRARTKIELHEFIRAVEPLDNGAAMVVQLNGLDEGWSPEHIEIAMLASYAHAMARSYDERFLRPVRNRQMLLATLSPAQRPVAELLASGQTLRAISERLGKSQYTVQEHAKRIYELLGVNCRFALRDKWHGCDEHPGYEPPER